MNYELLLQCYRSGQVSERQWQEHLKDENFKKWLETDYRERVEREVKEDVYC